MQVEISDLINIYENEIVKGVKNRKKILKFEANKIEYLIYIKNILENNLYKGSNYNIFLVFDPKISQYFFSEITAKRENIIVSYAIKLHKKYI